MSSVKKLKDKRLPPFVALPWAMLNVEAYKSLRHPAGKALPYFWGKPRAPFNNPAQYDTTIHFPYKEGQRYGFSPGTFSKVIRELVAKGFLDPVEKGGLRSHGKSYNLFKISNRWEKYGSDEFQPLDWKCFVPRPRFKPTSKKEIYNFKKGKDGHGESSSNSQNEAVEAVSA